MGASGLLPARLEGVEMIRRGRRIVGPIDLVLGPDGVTVVMGPNGSGKTSLLRLLHGLERVSRGKITWNVPPQEARRRQAFVFQTPILMHRSVLDNVAYPLRLRGAKRHEAREAAMAWLGRVGLADHAVRPSHVLSGGERQKMALARALVLEPELLILDEPCANLDGRATREIEQILGEARAAGRRIVFSTHDLGQARRLASEVVFVHHGRVHERGPAREFFERPATSEARAFLRGDIVE